MNLFFTNFKSTTVSGHKSKTQIIIFFLNIFLNKIAGIALIIGDGQKTKTTSNFFLKILKKPITKELKKKVM